MSKKAAIIISPNWRDYAKKYLADCLNSLRKQDWDGESKIFLVDNESTQQSYEYLKGIAPDCEILRNKDNDGFAKGNNVAIKRAMDENFDFIILINMDTMVDVGCLREMVTEAEKNAEVGAVQARLMLWPEKEKINSLGNVTHFLGFGYSLGYNEKFENQGLNSDQEVPICYPSGAAVLFKINILREIGVFDEEFWMYNEDQDLGWRIWLSGKKCVLAPRAIVYHKYEFSRSIKKYYWMDRNRVIAMLKNYHWLSIVLVLPAFFTMEFGLLLFSLKTGWFKEKIRVYKYFLSPTTWKHIISERKRIQNLRKVKDKDIVKMFSGRIWYQEVDDWKLRTINPVFNFYWSVIKKIIFW